MRTRRRRRPVDRSTWFLAGWCVVLGVAILAPLAAPGYALTYDMVFVPDQDVVDSTLGLGDGLPRAFPQDLVVALADEIVPGWLLQRIALIGAAVGAGAGVVTLMRRSPAAVRAVGATVYVWNAFVFERLAMGHWSLLAAYATLPWVLWAGLGARRGRPGVLPLGVLAVGLASVTPTGGVLAAPLLGGLVVAPGGRMRARDRIAAIAAIAALQVPWVVAGMLHPAAGRSDPAGVAAFASRADSPLGLIGSLATFGGIWNADVVPASRASWSSALISLALLVLAAAGAGAAAAVLGRAGAAVLTVLSVAGFAIAVAGAVPGGSDAVAWVVAEVPGGGIIRDGQKFVAWYCLGVAVWSAQGAHRLGTWLAGSRGRPPAAAIPVAALAALLPVAALPDLAWGAAGRIAPVTYPGAWDEIRAAVSSRGDEGDLIVLPYQPYRSFAWNGFRPVLDPAPRYFGVETVAPDALVVGDITVAGENARATDVTEALNGASPVEDLLSLGVAWVVVERDTPGRVPNDVVRELDPVVVTATMELYRVPGVARHLPGPAGERWVTAALLAALASITASAIRVVWVGRKRVTTW